MSPPPDDQEARTQRHLAVLDTLIAHGLDLANRVHHQATTPTPAEPGSAPVESTEPQPPPPITAETIALFDQISRAVRCAILVSRKLAEPLPLAPAKPGSASPDRTAARKRIIREVEDTIHREARGPGAETLQAELHERVESVDLDDDIGNRPIHEIIAEICRDLGVISTYEQARFKRRTPQDLQALTTRAARPTSPAEPSSAPAEPSSTPAEPGSAPAEPTKPRPSAPRPERPDNPETPIPALNGVSKPEPRPPRH